VKKTRASEGKSLGGVIVAATTPRRAREYSIDLAATLELVDFLGNSGVNAIALLGSTGEFVNFSLDDRRHMTGFAAKRSRVPLLVNVSHSTLDGAVELARDAANDGVAGVLVMPPFYFRYGQDAIRSFFLQLAAEVDNAVPIYLYNIPIFTNPIDVSTARELLSTGLFAGIKDSSGSWEYFEGLREHDSNSPFAFFAGSERLYVKAKPRGANGVISGVACALPELMLALDRGLSNGASADTSKFECRVLEFLHWADQFPAPVAIKEAIRLRKLKMGVLAVPVGPELERKLAEFAEWFLGWLPQVLRECGR
jgi:4-hydroxy-tetrahydrodipicolinate synthase